MTIEGAQKAMRKRNIEAEENDSDIKLLERLQSLRAMLVDMRNNIGEPLPEESLDEDSLVEESPIESQPVEEVVVPVVEEVVIEAPVVEITTDVESPTEEVKEVTIEDIFETKSDAPTEIVETAELPIAESAEPIVAEPDAAYVVEPQPVKRATPKKKRAPRRKLIGEEGVVERPLFPFYEQTLF